MGIRLLKLHTPITVCPLLTKEKQTSSFRFRLQEGNGSLAFPFSVSSKQMEIAAFR
jgi:hypothetical protein